MQEDGSSTALRARRADNVRSVPLADSQMHGGSYAELEPVRAACTARNLKLSSIWPPSSRPPPESRAIDSAGAILPPESRDVFVVLLPLARHKTLPGAPTCSHSRLRHQLLRMTIFVFIQTFN